MPGVIESGGAKGRRGLQHAVARFRRAARFGDDDDERAPELAADFLQDTSMPSGSVLSKK